MDQVYQSVRVSIAMAQGMSDDSAVLAEGFRCLHNPPLALRALEEPYLRNLRIGDDEGADLGALHAILKDAEAVELKIAGGGACAIHAAFGDSLRAGDAYVTHTQPRQYLGEILQRPLAVVLDDLTAKGQDLMRSVLASTWMKFVVPNVTASRGFRAPQDVQGSEARHFLRGLLLPEHRGLTEAILEQVRANNRVVAQRDIQRARGRIETCSIFRFDFEQRLWRRLGVEAGVLPGNLSDPIRMSAVEVADAIAASSEDVGGTFDFLEPPWEVLQGRCVVKGIAGEVWPYLPGEGPETKYAALFDPHEAFNGLRLSFISRVVGDDFANVDDVLSAEILTLCRTDHDGVGALLSFRNTFSQAFGRLGHVSAMPTNYREQSMTNR